MATPKKKLCWNCEGRVSLEEENCPYCAVYLGPAPDSKGGSRDNFSPPYRLVESEEEVSSPPPSPYASKTHDADEIEDVDSLDIMKTKSGVRQFALPLGLLSGGTLFLIFGCVLWMFSENGVLTLTWSGDYWYIYIGGSLPMLFVGWRLMQNNDRGDEENGSV